MNKMHTHKAFDDANTVQCSAAKGGQPQQPQWGLKQAKERLYVAQQASERASD